MAVNTLLDALEERLRARVEGGGVDAGPAAILWPDEARAWEPVVPLLRSRLPIVTLGPWDPATASGPAFWIRCIVDGALVDRSLPAGVPVVSLPGVPRRDIRAAEDAPDALKPLAELQYRGTIFAHPN